MNVSNFLIKKWGELPLECGGPAPLSPQSLCQHERVGLHVRAGISFEGKAAQDRRTAMYILDQVFIFPSY